MGNRTEQAVDKQIAAMGAELFEIGLFKPADPSAARKEAEMLPRTWDTRTLVNSIGWLRYQNSVGRNIYIRPKGEHHLTLVDDLNAANLDRMQRHGFEPCLIVETSPANFQAWLNHGTNLPKAESTAAARALAERFDGDTGAADWRHFGRLAGFTNRKEKYRQPGGLFPFVRLIGASPGRVYSNARGFVDEVRAKVEESIRARAFAPALNIQRMGGRLLTIDDFRAKPEYDGDGNRIDLAYAVYAIAHGLSESAVRAAIASRDLSKKGSEARQIDYVERTVRKAISAVTVGPTQGQSSIPAGRQGR